MYRLTARGDRRDAIYHDDEDRRAFLALVGQVCHRFAWRCYAYCLMSNHYHLLVETRDGNLARGMRQLNGVYTQRVNRRHGQTGHVFQGRYGAVLVQKERYLLAVSRYIVLNPVRAGMVANAGAWPWSSYRMVMGRESAPTWVPTDWLLAQFERQRTRARMAYRRFVHGGVGAPSLWAELRHQLFLGDQAFINRFRGAQPTAEEVGEIPKAQRRVLAWSLEDYRAKLHDRDDALAKAYLSGRYTMKEIGDYFGVHYVTVSRAVKKFESAALP